MKATSPKLIAGIGALTAIIALEPALAADNHNVLTPDEIKWAPAPAAIPKGAEMAVLFGDPSKDGPFALRLKMPAGYYVPPHIHPKPEVVTVLSGTLNLGEGATADKSKTKALGAGSFLTMPLGMQHYIYADQETIIQLNTSGPWGITYVNEKDDPRKTQ